MCSLIFLFFFFCKAQCFCRSGLLVGAVVVVVVALLVAAVAAAAVIVALIVVVAIDMVARRALCSHPLHRIWCCQIESMLLLVCAWHWQSTRCFAIWRWFQFTLYTTCTYISERERERASGAFLRKKKNEIITTHKQSEWQKKRLQTVHSSGQRTRVTEMKTLKESMNERAFIRVHKWHKMRRMSIFYPCLFPISVLSRCYWQCYLHCSRCIGNCVWLRWWYPMFDSVFMCIMPVDTINLVS